mgnify:CR=1 FL=1
MEALIFLNLSGILIFLNLFEVLIFLNMSGILIFLNLFRISIFLTLSEFFFIFLNLSKVLVFRNLSDILMFLCLPWVSLNFSRLLVYSISKCVPRIHRGQAKLKEFHIAEAGHHVHGHFLLLEFVHKVAKNTHTLLVASVMRTRARDRSMIILTAMLIYILPTVLEKSYGKKKLSWTAIINLCFTCPYGTKNNGY